MSNKVPNGWKQIKIGEIVCLNQHSIDSTYRYQNILYLDIGSIKEGKITDIKEYKLSEAPSSAKRLVKHNNIIYSTVRPILKHCGIIKNPPDNLVVSTGFVVIEVKEDIADPSFIYYYLISDKTVTTLNKIAEDSRSMYPSFRPYEIENLDILLPPLSEQRAIASIFPPIENKIELLLQENGTLQNIIDTLFRQWFIKDPQSKEVFLKDIYVFEKGFEPGSGNYLESEGEDTIRFIRVRDMDNKNPSVYIRKSLAKNICTANDLLLALAGSPGKLGFGVEGAYSSAISKIYSKDTLYDNLWLKYLIFKSDYVQSKIKAYASGTTISYADSCINKLTFRFPERIRIEEFNELVHPTFSKILSNQQQIRTLTQLRDNLLPALMSGLVRVTE